MQAKLTTEEMFGLLANRYYDYSNVTSVGCADEWNATVAILRDFVESFSEGRLKVIATPESI